MGNKILNPCPLEQQIQKQSTSQLIFSHKSSLSESISVKQFKHSIEIQGPSQVYKKSLRKDLNTVEIADQILISFDMDKCFIKYECESMINTKATQDSLNTRQASFHPKKTLNRKKTKLHLAQISG